MPWHQTDQSAAPKVALGSPEPSERDQPVPVLKTVGGTFRRDGVQPWTRRCPTRSPSSNTLHCIRPILDPRATHVFGHRANDELAEPVVSDRIDQRTVMTHAKVGAPTQRKARRLLQGILQSAVVRGLLPVHPAQLVDNAKADRASAAASAGDFRADLGDHAPTAQQDRCDGRPQQVCGTHRGRTLGILDERKWTNPLQYFQWTMLGSNQRPPPCRGGALPAELIVLGSGNSSERGAVRHAPTTAINRAVAMHQSRRCDARMSAVLAAASLRSWPASWRS
jgi:hypothetical protein